MTSTEALLRAGLAVIDEVGHWHRNSQARAVGSVAWAEAQGAIEALNRISERLYVMLQEDAMVDAGLPLPEEPTSFRVIQGGRS